MHPGVERHSRAYRISSPTSVYSGLGPAVPVHCPRRPVDRLSSYAGASPAILCRVDLARTRLQRCIVRLEHPRRSREAAGAALLTWYRHPRGQRRRARRYPPRGPRVQPAEQSGSARIRRRRPSSTLWAEPT